MEDNRVPELAIGETVLVKNVSIVNGVPKQIIEGKARVVEILDFDLRDNVYHCRVEFKNEPGETYERFIWL